MSEEEVRQMIEQATEELRRRIDELERIAAHREHRHGDLADRWHKHDHSHDRLTGQPQ